MRMIQIQQEDGEWAINPEKVIAVVKNAGSEMVEIKTEGEDFEFNPDDDTAVALDNLYQAILQQLALASCVGS